LRKKEGTLGGFGGIDPPLKERETIGEKTIERRERSATKKK